MRTNKLKLVLAEQILPKQGKFSTSCVNRQRQCIQETIGYRLIYGETYPDCDQRVLSPSLELQSGPAYCNAPPRWLLLRYGPVQGYSWSVPSLRASLPFLPHRSFAVRLMPFLLHFADFGHIHLSAFKNAFHAGLLSSRFTMSIRLAYTSLLHSPYTSVYKPEDSYFAIAEWGQVHTGAYVEWLLNRLKHLLRSVTILTIRPMNVTLVWDHCEMILVSLPLFAEISQFATHDIDWNEEFSSLDDLFLECVLYEENGKYRTPIASDSQAPNFVPAEIACLLPPEDRGVNSLSQSPANGEKDDGQITLNSQVPNCTRAESAALLPCSRRPTCPVPVTVPFV